MNEGHQEVGARYFFFSSRRRHTRLQGDWSSDVCSSDLKEPGSSAVSRTTGGPSYSTSAGPPVVLDTALLPGSFLPPAAKETRSDCLCLDGCAPRGTSRQRNTHNIELREVRYPWHTWHARTVAVHEALTRNGRAVCRCGVDENPGGRLLEIPQWMFDSVACCRM